MNRLVIIGNGFDLAHGLPTSYRDFIDNYWSNIKDSNHDELVSFNLDEFVEFKKHNNLNDLINEIIEINIRFKKDGIEVFKLKDFPVPKADNRIQIINFKNKLFKLINFEAIENWVDIENLYFEILKEEYKGSNTRYEGSIKDLNREFEEIKNYLIKYLYKIGDNRELMDRRIYELKNILQNNFHQSESINDYLQEFPEEDQDKLMIENEIFQKHFFANGNFEGLKDTNIIENQLYCLSFNYTPLIERYLRDINNFDKITSNFIHGKLNFEGQNPINFGFGDEMNDSYKSIENINNNDYLKFFKSFYYLQNSNYRELLSFIEGSVFQVYIMGHSCGLSDRTLLNTIFEHEHCRSIKVFYHQEEDENGDIKGDNYTDLVQNISRHFTDKKLMRSKLVNKELCKPLPQIQLPKKE